MFRLGCDRLLLLSCLRGLRWDGADDGVDSFFFSDGVAETLKTEDKLGVMLVCAVWVVVGGSKGRQQQQESPKYDACMLCWFVDDRQNDARCDVVRWHRSDNYGMVGWVRTCMLEASTLKGRRIVELRAVRTFIY